MLGLAIGAVVTLAVLVFARAARRGQARNEAAWRAWAERRGLAPTAAGLAGTIDGVDVLVELALDARRHPARRIVGRALAPVGVTFGVACPRPFEPTPPVKFAPTGDASFDAKVTVTTDDERPMRSVMTPALRRRLLDEAARRRFLRLEYDRGVVRMWMTPYDPGEGADADLALVVAVCRAGAE